MPKKVTHDAELDALQAEAEALKAKCAPEGAAADAKAIDPAVIAGLIDLALKLIAFFRKK